MRDQSQRLVAAMDIGSNSVRLLLAKVEPGGQPVTLHKQAVITRISEGMTRSGYLSEEAMLRTLDAITVLQEKAHQMQAQALYCFGTAALREAGNRDVFLQRVKQSTGLDIDVLSADMEARVGFIGAQRRGAMGVIDIGGGSTELAVGADGQVAVALSLKMGAVRALERYPIGIGQPDALTLEAMNQWASHLLKQGAQGVLGAHRAMQGVVWCGMGGTITTLAAMCMRLQTFDSAKVQGYLLTYPAVERLYKRMTELTLERRRTLPGLQSERADIIIGGVTILIQFMRYMDIKELHVSQSDNLEGYLRYKLPEKKV